MLREFVCPPSNGKSTLHIFPAGLIDAGLASFHEWPKYEIEL